MNQNKLTNYVGGIDGLRAIAVIAVILFHMNVSGILKGGFTGVDVFFVISGYVISKSLFHHSDKNFLTFISDFYKRRILRILPLLITVITMVMLLAILFIPSSWKSEMIQKTGLASYMGYSNFSLIWTNDGYFSPLIAFNPFAHTWSLAVEEQFYLFFPIIYFIWLKMKDRQDIKRFTGMLLILCLAGGSFGYSVYVTKYNPNAAYYLLPGRFWELAAGAILFQLHSKDLLLFRSPRTAMWGSVFGLGFIIFGFIYADESAFPYPWAIIPVVGTMLAISGVIDKKEGSWWDIRKLLESKVLTQIGKMSYSLYLWHWPIAVLLKWTMGFESLLSKAVYLSLSAVFSLFTYHAIEKSIQRNTWIRNQRAWKVIITGSFVVLTGYFTSSWMINNQSTISLSVTKDTYTWYAWKFPWDGPQEPIIDDPDVNGRRLFAIGDSHTAAYRTMLNIVSKELGIEVFVHEQGGCGVLNLMKPMDQTEGCLEFYNNALEDIKENARPGDVVFLASLRMPELSNRFELVDVETVLDDYYSEEAVKNRKLAYEEADAILNDLEKMGVHVLMEEPLPQVLIPPFRCSDWFNRMNPIAKPGASIRREVLDRARQPVMDSINKLLFQHDKLYVWDPMEVLCPGETMNAYDADGKPLFYDGDHLSANGNRVLVPSFRKILLDIWSQRN